MNETTKKEPKPEKKTSVSLNVNKREAPVKEKKQEVLPEENIKDSLPTEVNMSVTKEEVKDEIKKETTIDISFIKNNLIKLDKNEVIDINQVIQTANTATKGKKVYVPVVLPVSKYMVKINSLSLIDIDALIHSEHASLHDEKEALYRMIYNKIESTSLDDKNGKINFDTWAQITANTDMEVLLYGIFSATYPGKRKFNLRCNNYKSVQNKDILGLNKDNETKDENKVEEVKVEKTKEEIDKEIIENLLEEKLIDSNEKQVCGHRFTDIQFYPSDLVGKLNKKILDIFTEITYSSKEEQIKAVKSSSVFNAKFIKLDSEPPIMLEVKVPSIKRYLDVLKIVPKEDFVKYQTTIASTVYITKIYLPQFKNKELKYIEIENIQEIFDWFAFKFPPHLKREFNKKINEDVEDLEIKFETPNVVCPECNGNISVEVSIEKILFREIYS